jgi:predicted ATP-dependent serine protease
MKNLTMVKRGKGRPKKSQPTPVVEFDPKSVQIYKGSELKFNDSVFRPMRTGTMMDDLLSADKGLMPAVNMIICGGPGTGKSTVVLDMLARLGKSGKKVLFVSGEMDEIGHFKYCKRMPHFATVPTLFLKNYTETVKETMEYVFEQGYDVIAIDSIAEVIEMYKDTYRTTESAAELWFLNLQSQIKKGENKLKKYTTFINIQQVTKAGDFAGSNRLKHMTEAMCHLERIKDSDSRKVYFSKNRDNSIDFHITYRIGLNQVEYSLADAGNDE